MWVVQGNMKQADERAGRVGHRAVPRAHLWRRASQRRRAIGRWRPAEVAAKRARKDLVTLNPAASATSTTESSLASSRAAAPSRRSRSVYCFGVSPTMRRNARCKWKGDHPARVASASSDTFASRRSRMARSNVSRSRSDGISGAMIDEVWTRLLDVSCGERESDAELPAPWILRAGFVRLKPDTTVCFDWCA